MSRVRKRKNMVKPSPPKGGNRPASHMPTRRQPWMVCPQSEKHLNKLKRLRIAPVCPKCGNEVPGVASRHGIQHGCCGLRSYDYRPLVTPATLSARIKAHKAFDPLWREGHLERNQAYARLAGLLGIHKEQCHMSLMDEATATRAATIALEMLWELRRQAGGAA